MCSCFLVPGDIGGQMGLFIGASILTILELFDYLYEVRLESYYTEKVLYTFDKNIRITHDHIVKD